MHDVLIVGAGLSGLAAGIRLALFDQRVAIVERHSLVGGLNSFYRRRGRPYDVGLHALTNYAPGRPGPLTKLLRQLRLAPDDFALDPQRGSAIVFPGARLRFSNDPELLRAEIRREFPERGDRFERFAAGLLDYRDLGRAGSERSARAFLSETLDAPLLAEMLLAPTLFYGGSREDDLDLGSFSILFRSIFLEGLCRPRPGVRQILQTLVRRFEDLGGELRTRCGVRRLALGEGRIEKALLDDGSELAARFVISSAGLRETLRLCGQPDEGLPAAGRLSFVETASILDVAPARLGLDQAAVFYNDGPSFRYARPEGLVDLRSGVVCSPDNFEAPERDEGIVRMTVLANYEAWSGLEPAAYREAKTRCYTEIAAAATRFVPDFRGRVIDGDLFTPTTLRRYTGHDEGAVYGSPEKRYDGATPWANLSLCGTDQGLVGIVGAMLSGVAAANRLLK